MYWFLMKLESVGNFSGLEDGVFSWTFFEGNVAQVVALVAFLGGLLLNFKTDAAFTKLLGVLLLLVGTAIIVIRVLLDRGILPL